jgi:serine/threonine-protein kinase
MTIPNKLESGTIFGATYKIIDFIGEGGMGLVYKVEHLLMTKLLALKILKTENLTEAVWKRFRAEGQAIARLDHRNIVRIYDMSQSEDGVPFYTMDLLIGQSLADYLQEKHRLTEAEALPIFRQVCAGLAYAHERGIFHRDIKPGNIMLIDRAEADKTKAVDISKKLVKIVDFGIAKLTDESGITIQGLTKPGEVFGSPLYMSPEQCNGQKVDQRSDLYSVGITLFQALTGKPPLLGKTAIETTMMHQTTKPARLNDLSDQIEYSPRLEALVTKMLAAEGIAVIIIVDTQAKSKNKQAQIIQAKIEEKEQADQVRRAWNLPPKPEIKKQRISTILQPILNQVTNDAVKAFLQSNENKFSQSKLVANKKQLTFNFPESFSLGKLVCLGEHNYLS